MVALSGLSCKLLSCMSCARSHLCSRGQLDVRPAGTLLQLAFGSLHATLMTGEALTACRLPMSCLYVAACGF